MDQLSAMMYDDENQELKEFYESHLQFFKKCSMPKSLTPTELRKIAVTLHSKSFFKHDWQEYATEMGITDNMELATIKVSADLREEMALYVTMTTALQRINGNLSNIIRAMLKTKRYDVLKYLQPHALKLLEKSSACEVKEFACVKEQLPCIKNKDVYLSLEGTEQVNNASVSSDNFYFEKSENSFPLELGSEFVSNPPSHEFEALQKNIKSTISELKSLPSSNAREQKCGDVPSQEIVFFPPAPSFSHSSPEPSAPSFSHVPPEERLSVFIQHTEFDIDVAKQLSVYMKKSGFTVTTSFQVDRLIAMDSTGALSTIFQEVDFIVPVVSKQFLHQIHPKIYEKYLESSDAKTNRTLYQLIMTEYQNNGCVNFRVRPVLVPDMNRRLLTSDVVLSYSFRLWNELPKLIRILRETKELIPQYPFY